MNKDPASVWRRRLLSVGTPVVAGVDFRAEFRDDAGHRREVDRAFLAWCERGGPGVDKSACDGVGAGGAVEVALWAALATGAEAREVESALQIARSHERTAWDSGALLPQGRTALEVWTETDLCCLHALWWLARLHQREDWAVLVDDAAGWHLENVQPDNATTHPWGLHLFALRDIRAGCGGGGGGDGAARLHAEMMLHNCQVSLGRADRLSALILVDAARAIGTACPEG